MISPYVYVGLIEPIEVKKITTDHVIATVAKAYGVTPEDIKGSSRKTIVKIARHVTAWVLFTKQGKTHLEVAAVLGYSGKDMSRVAVRNVYDALDVQDELVAPYISKILKLLY